MRPRPRLASFVMLLALVVPSAFLGSGCGGGGGGPFTTITFDNAVLSSGTVVQVDFAYFVASGLPDRIESVSIPPGTGLSFGFSQFESDNFVDVVLTWDDATTDTIPLLLISGGEFVYPISH